MFNRNDLAEAALILLLVGIFLLSVAIFFILTLRKALRVCSPQSRTLSPGSAWLLLIPLFNIVWQFVLIVNVASSLGNEFRLRGMIRKGDPGKMLGLSYCILGLCGLIPVVGILASIAGFICFIIYWVKIDRYASDLELSTVGVSAPK